MGAAGQMSLANVLAAAQAASSVVLLGDPRQLDQPQKGSHPSGVEVSALDHLLGGEETMPVDRGLFLETTWSLLSSRRDPERQSTTAGPIGQVGLYFHPVEHTGNTNSSAEEVNAVEEIVKSLLTGNNKWTNREGALQNLEENAILIIAPYNAQVALLSERLPTARVGTVDKFQGQEAAVVIYSMASSLAITSRSYPSLRTRIS